MLRSGVGSNARLIEQPDSITDSVASHPGGQYRLASLCGGLSHGFGRPRWIGHRLGSEDCQDGERCLTHELWQQLGSRIHDFLDDITLAGFLQRKQVNAIVRRQQQGVDVAVPGKTVA